MIRAVVADGIEKKSEKLYALRLINGDVVVEIEGDEDDVAYESVAILALSCELLLGDIERDRERIKEYLDGITEIVLECVLRGQEGLYN